VSATAVVTLALVELILKILDWLVANKTVGIPAACALALGLGLIGWLVKRWHGQRATFDATAPHGNVQQVNVERVRSKGDVNITNRQE
jgi:hypothetical protein